MASIQSVMLFISQGMRVAANTSCWYLVCAEKVNLALNITINV